MINAIEVIKKRYNISNKQMAEASFEDKIEIVQSALDQLALALTDCDYMWPQELREHYETTTEIINALKAKGVEVE
jgi:hypothetical protein